MAAEEAVQSVAAPGADGCPWSRATLDLAAQAVPGAVHGGSMVNAQEEGSTTGGGGECGGPVAEEGSRGVGVECGSPVTEEGSVLLTRRGLVGGEGAWAAWHLDKEDKVEGR
jgi:hypothetical protein